MSEAVEKNKAALQSKSYSKLWELRHRSLTYSFPGRDPTRSYSKRTNRKGHRETRGTFTSLHAMMVRWSISSESSRGNEKQTSLEILCSITWPESHLSNRKVSNMPELWEGSLMTGWIGTKRSWGNTGTGLLIALYVGRKKSKSKWTFTQNELDCWLKLISATWSCDYSSCLRYNLLVTL